MIDTALDAADVDAMLANIEKHRSFFKWEKIDCYLEMHAFLFWVGLAGKLATGTPSDPEAMFGFRGYIDEIRAYVKNYVEKNVIVLHHRPTRKFVIIRRPFKKP